jgi:hypothetical protein
LVQCGFLAEFNDQKAVSAPMTTDPLFSSPANHLGLAKLATPFSDVRLDINHTTGGKMKFSESEIQPLWDEVSRIIGDAVIQLHHHGKPFNAEVLVKYLSHQLSEVDEVKRRILLNAAINMLKTNRIRN